MGLYLGLRE